MPQQPSVSRLRSIRSSARKAIIPGQDVGKDIIARKREIEEANVDPYPQYARSEESVSLSSFAEKFEYLEPGKSQGFDESTGSGSLLVEGSNGRTAAQVTN